MFFSSSGLTVSPLPNTSLPEYSSLFLHVSITVGAPSLESLNPAVQERGTVWGEGFSFSLVSGVSASKRLFLRGILRRLMSFVFFSPRLVFFRGTLYR